MFVALKKGLTFLKKQKRNFWALLGERMGRGAVQNWMQQYQSLYIKALGGSTEYIGTLNSLGRIVNGLVSIPIGWLMDKYSKKKVMIIASIGMIIYPVLYALSSSWEMLVPAIILSTIVVQALMFISTIMVADSVEQSSRATGFGVITSLSTIPAIVSPIIAGYIVSVSGGFSREGIRPLFWIMSVSGLIVTIILSFTLQEKNAASPEKIKGLSSFIEDFKVVFREGVGIKRMLGCTLADTLGFSMTMPYVYLYAVELKNASPTILGLMGMTSSIGSVLLNIPVGRLADKYGRKKTMFFFVKPLWYLSSILFILIPSNKPELLIPLFFLRSLPMSSGILWWSMQMEQVRPEHRGRWNSIISFVRPLTGIPAPIIGAYLWSNISPSAIFIGHTLTDVLILMPLLSAIPETLEMNNRHNKIQMKTIDK